MRRALLFLPLFLLACGVSTLPTPAPVIAPHANAVLSAPVSIVHKHIDEHPDGKATVIWFEPVTKDTTK